MPHDQFSSLLLPPPKGLAVTGPTLDRASLGPEPTVTPDPALPEHAYRLALDAGGPRIQASHALGERHARATLAQIRRIAQSGLATIPACEIEDAPALARRGVMLDVSRFRIPTTDEFARIVPLFASLKLDHLQCYTEHAFAYRDHPEVWAGTDPITHDQARALDHLCRSHGVELAANQNCFGHLARWLATPGYEDLAETHCDWIFAGMPRSGPFSLCPEDPRSLALVESMLDDLLPCFASPLVNIGCDETYDVGQGRSRAAVERDGKAAIYGRFVGAVCRAVLRRGRTPMFWGDIAGEHPEALDHLPPGAVALPWGYEPGHDFAAEGRVYRERGMPWWACCGTSSWRSFTGRSSERRANIRRAAAEAVGFGAEGLLVTDWGDVGHRQVWPIALLAIAEAADAGWTSLPRGPRFLDAVSLHAFGDASLKIAPWLEELGDADEPLRAVSGKPAADGSPTRLLNASALFTELHPPPLTLGLPADPKPWLDTRDRLRHLGGSIPTGADPLVERELRHAVRCATWACDVALLRRGSTQRDAAALTAERGDIKAQQRELWLERSRPGGLDESLAHWDTVALIP